MVCVYDSGVGGLSALTAIRRQAPLCDILYLGDSARVPYGTRSPGALLGFAREALDYLAGYAPSLVLVACGTVSTVCLPSLSGRYPFPVVGVAEAGVAAAIAAAPHRRIAVLGTEATVGSGYLERRILALSPDAHVASLACPMLVSLAEGGFVGEDDPIPSLVTERLLAPLRAEEPEAVILGCTHFAWLAPHIARALPGATLIDCSAATARALAPRLLADGGTGRTEVLVTDNPAGFARTAARALGVCLACEPRLVSLTRPAEGVK